MVTDSYGDGSAGSTIDTGQALAVGIFTAYMRVTSASLGRFMLLDDSLDIISDTVVTSNLPATGTDHGFGQSWGMVRTETTATKQLRTFYAHIRSGYGM